MVFLKPKPLTIESRGKGGGGGFLVGSSLPNHDAKVGKERQKQKQKPKKKNKENPRQTTLERVRQSNNKNNNLYGAWHECTYDACPNALKFVQLYFINQQLTWT